MSNYSSLIFILFIFCFQQFIYSSASDNNTINKTLRSRQEITLGPVIGKVTERTARILVEFKKSGHITMFLKEVSTKKKRPNRKKPKNIRRTLRVVANTPIVFKFRNLHRGRKYVISFSPKLKTKSGLIASFRTLRGKITLNKKFNLIFLSCNDIRYAELMPKQAQLWNQMSLRAQKGEIDYKFHIGDQIYADHDAWIANTDNVYTKAKLMAKNTHYSKYEQFKEIIREMLRNEFRRTWGFQALAKVLSLVPNEMMFDDHEFYDGFGFFGTQAAYNDITSFEHYYSRQARYVYYQYERQLREDIDFKNYEKTKDEYYNEIFNGVGFLVMDSRGPKTFHKILGIMLQILKLDINKLKTI